jgi:hypothetical protein
MTPNYEAPRGLRTVNIRRLEMLSAAIEAATGLGLIAVPNLVARLLLGADLADSGIAVARLTGIALVCLALACWPSGTEATPPAGRALFTYNLLAALYLGYLRVGGGFVGYLLWPAFVLHAVLAVLLARATRARSAEQE